MSTRYSLDHPIMHGDVLPAGPTADDVLPAGPTADDVLPAGHTAGDVLPAGPTAGGSSRLQRTTTTLRL